MMSEIYSVFDCSVSALNVEFSSIAVSMESFGVVNVIVKELR